jgi:outer membrane beta-barrel protein
MRERTINSGDRAMTKRALLLLLTFSILCLPAAAHSARAPLWLAPVLPEQIDDRRFADTQPAPTAVAAVYFPVTRPLDRLAVEEQANSSRSGMRLAYPIAADLFLEAAYRKSRLGRAGRQWSPGQPRQFPDGQSRVKYYDVSLGYNLAVRERIDRGGGLRGSALYLIAGVGALEHGGEEVGGFSYGMGYRAAATESLVFHLSVRDRFIDARSTFALRGSRELEFAGMVTVRF